MHNMSIFAFLLSSLNLQKNTSSVPKCNFVQLRRMRSIETLFVVYKPWLMVIFYFSIKHFIILKIDVRPVEYMFGWTTSLAKLTNCIVIFFCQNHDS